MSDSPIKKLLEFGQSPWLDFIQRDMLLNGELKRMIEEWGLRGMTSNPAIFEKAIAHTRGYDNDILELTKDGKSAEQICETVALKDVRTAADLFRPVYEASDGADGFVSHEVSPHLARDAGRTIEEAKRLWLALDRPNVMIKVPGTPEGLTASRSLLGEGININVTLLFSISRYRKVLETFLDGVGDALAAGRTVDRIASVASFFLSRIDTVIDRKLDRITAIGNVRGRKAERLRGRVAIASARMAYGLFEDSLMQESFRRLNAQGLRPQRLLWASTGTKDPSYSDIKYVEPLIGPNTVNTMPLATLAAFNDHGCPAPRLTKGRKEAECVVECLADLGINLDEATDQLLEEGIDKFVRPYDALIQAIENKRQLALSA